ncbi:MAG: hypothetical protein NTY48_00450 [Candidatus Diapherotrites archaeon]|nr:hypothetical protein [Candidatus Diapherotrites archaeon]
MQDVIVLPRTTYTKKRKALERRRSLNLIHGSGMDAPAKGFVSSSPLAMKKAKKHLFKQLGLRMRSHEPIGSPGLEVDATLSRGESHTWAPWVVKKKMTEQEVGKAISQMRKSDVQRWLDRPENRRQVRRPGTPRE